MVVGEKVQGPSNPDLWYGTRKLKFIFEEWGRGHLSSYYIPVGVAPAEGMSSRESDDLLVVEAHTVENVPEMLGTLGRIRQTSIRGSIFGKTVDSARAPWAGLFVENFVQ